MLTVPCPLCHVDHPAVDNVCPGPCNRAWHAAEHRQHTTGQPHDLLPIPGQPLWCPECRDTIEHDLAGLPSLIQSLGSGPLTQPDPATGRLHLVNVHASPSPAFDLADEVTRWAKAWADTTRHWLGDPPGPSTFGYLAGRLSPILARDPDGYAFGHETLTWHRRLSHVTGSIHARITVRVPGECPHCHRRGTLIRRDGTELVRCTACPAVRDFERIAG